MLTVKLTTGDLLKFENAEACDLRELDRLVVVANLRESLDAPRKILATFNWLSVVGWTTESNFPDPKEESRKWHEKNDGRVSKITLPLE